METRRASKLCNTVQDQWSYKWGSRPHLFRAHAIQIGRRWKQTKPAPRQNASWSKSAQVVAWCNRSGRADLSRMSRVWPMDSPGWAQLSQQSKMLGRSQAARQRLCLPQDLGMQRQAHLDRLANFASPQLHPPSDHNKDATTAMTYFWLKLDLQPCTVPRSSAPIEHDSGRAGKERAGRWFAAALRLRQRVGMGRTISCIRKPRWIRAERSDEAEMTLWVIRPFNAGIVTKEDTQTLF